MRLTEILKFIPQHTIRSVKMHTVHPDQVHKLELAADPDSAVAPGMYGTSMSMLHASGQTSPPMTPEDNVLHTNVDTRSYDTMLGTEIHRFIAKWFPRPNVDEELARQELFEIFNRHVDDTHRRVRCDQVIIANRSNGITVVPHVVGYRLGDRAFTLDGQPLHVSDDSHVVPVEQ